MQGEDAALADLSAEFAKRYAPVSRPSIPPSFKEELDFQKLGVVEKIGKKCDAGTAGSQTIS